MDIIRVKNIKLYAYHGCLKEERTIGSEYLVNVEVGAYLTNATITDDLTDTADYVLVNAIVKEEMAVPSDLLEHVANRILDRLFSEIPILEIAEVAVAKINPPIGGDVDQVEVVLRRNKS